MKRRLRGWWRSSDRVRAVGNTSPFITARHSHIYFEPIPYTCFCKCQTRWCICPQLKMLGNRKWVSLIELRQLHLGIHSLWSQTECSNLKCNIYRLNSLLDCIISSRVSVMKCEQIIIIIQKVSSQWIIRTDDRCLPPCRVSVSLDLSVSHYSRSICILISIMFSVYQFWCSTHSLFCHCVSKISFLSTPC